MKFFPVPFTDCRTFCFKLLQAGRKERRVVKVRLLMAFLPLFSLMPDTVTCVFKLQADIRFRFRHSGFFLILYGII